MLTRDQLFAALANANVQALGRVVRQGETDQSDAAYRRRYNGAGPAAYFESFADHPRILVAIPNDPQGRSSSAAGAYQITRTTWDTVVLPALHAIFGLDAVDFSPPMQDAAFVVLLHVRNALNLIVTGQLEAAIAACRDEWTSLPGAAENHARWNLAAARDLYQHYGGRFVSASASTPPVISPAPASSRASAPEDTPMADAVDTAAGIVSIFNPAIGGAIGLAGQLFKSFAPMLQEKAAKEINRHTDDPAIGTKIAGDLATMLVSQAKVLTGKSDDFQAVAAITQDPSQAENLAKLQASLDSHLDKLMQAGDKASQWDQAMWTAQNVGKQTVSSIAIEEHKAGLWDMTKTLVYDAAFSNTAIGVTLAAAIAYQSIWAPKGIDPVLLALAGPILMQIVSKIKDILSYRFDGTKQQSDQSKALVQGATKGVTQ